MTEEERAAEFLKLDTYKSKPVKFAHDYAFDQITADMPDYFGKLLRLSDPVSVRWQQWKKGITAAQAKYECSPTATLYMQKFGHLASPPVAFTPPRFTWSPSKLMTFETCPMKFAAESYYKTVPYTESVQSIWGTRVHAAAEDYFNGKVPEPEAFKVVEDYCKVLDRLPGDRLVEHKISLDENWRPAEWDSGKESLRCILDLGFKHKDTLKCYDWKTGKVKDDPIQMQIYCVALAILNPEVNYFDFRYIWLKERTTTGFKLERKDLMPVAKDVMARVKRMKEAWDNESFNQRKNGLCRNYCGALECPYNGR